MIKWLAQSYTVNFREGVVMEILIFGDFLTNIGLLYQPSVFRGIYS